MSYRLTFRARVARDLAAARQWYESQSGEVLGERFLSAVTEVFTQIQAQPHAFQLVNEEVRHAVVRRFPYLVFFLFERNEIVILAVLHTSRNPLLWPQSKERPR